MTSGDDTPKVQPDQQLTNALLEISARGLGMVAVCQHDALVGVFTDGDLRRVIDSRLNIHETTIGDVMICEPKSTRPDMMAAEAVYVMETNRITALPVVDGDNLVVGALNIHDLFRAGVV